MLGSNFERALLHNLGLTAPGFAVALGLLGCGNPPSQELVSSGGSGSSGGSVHGGSAGSASPGGSNATGGRAGREATAGEGTAGTGTGGTVGGSGGGPSTSGRGGTGGSDRGGAGATGGFSGTSTGGVAGDATAGTAGGPTAGSGGVPAAGSGNIPGETGLETIPGSGCKAPGAYANLFAAVSGHTQEETDEKVAAAWNQLFDPSNANTVYYDGPGADESYVKDTGNNDVRTEGMSYGMMTAVQLDKQEEFDRLWTWVKNHMAQGTTGEIAWQCSTNGNKLSNGGAPDGEEYMATALIFAKSRWGDSGKFDYAVEAQWVLDLIRTKYFSEMYHIVKFVSSVNHTDGSYILPSFYQTWACFDTANAEFWNASVTAGREFFQAAANSNGVIPDQSSFTGEARGGAGSDAKRCVMNIMMDANFFAADPWQTETYAPAFGSYMRTNGDNTAAQYSCNALLGFGLPEATGKAFVDKLWDAPIPTGQWRYYDGTLYMLSLLHVSGAFKLYY